MELLQVHVPVVPRSSGRTKQLAQLRLERPLVHHLQNSRPIRGGPERERSSRLAERRGAFCLLPQDHASPFLFLDNGGARLDARRGLGHSRLRARRGAVVHLAAARRRGGLERQGKALLRAACVEGPPERVLRGERDRTSHSCEQADASKNKKARSFRN